MLFSSELLLKLKVSDWGYTEEVEPRSFDQYKDWVDQGHSDPLKYLEDHRMQARESLDSVLPGAKSAVVFLFNYHPEKIRLSHWLKKIKSPLKMASYIFGFEGRDYHDVVKERLETLAKSLKEDYPNLNYRVCLDIHPILERDLALRAGLGWFGKNSMLISREHGSFTIIGSLILDDSIPEGRMRTVDTDHCGQCRACIDACPTSAILEDKRQIVASKCISTFTIELFKDEVKAPRGMENGGGEIFGCDICQDICPWNKRPERLGLSASDEKSFAEKNNLILSTFLNRAPSETIEELSKLSNGAYKRMFKGTPLERTGRVGMLKNLKFWSS